MTEIEYQNFLKLPVIDRIVKMNSGTIKQNLDFMIETSNAEKEVFMTEPIMINDVDVSGCIHYKNQTCIANYLFTNIPFSEAKCKISPNCHYKQLKRKEQECERYKKCLKEIKSVAQNACDNCQECTTEFNLQTSCEYYEILKIINEVENEF